MQMNPAYCSRLQNISTVFPDDFYSYGAAFLKYLYKKVTRNPDPWDGLYAETKMAPVTGKSFLHPPHMTPAWLWSCDLSLCTDLHFP